MNAKHTWELGTRQHTEDGYPEGTYTIHNGNGAAVAYAFPEHARLIASAPALLEALTLAQATIERLAHRDRNGFSSVNGTLDVVERAIAAATGGDGGDL